MRTSGFTRALTVATLTAGLLVLAFALPVLGQSPSAAPNTAVGTDAAGGSTALLLIFIGAALAIAAIGSLALRRTSRS